LIQTNPYIQFLYIYYKNVVGRVVAHIVSQTYRIYTRDDAYSSRREIKPSARVYRFSDEWFTKEIVSEIPTYVEQSIYARQDLSENENGVTRAGVAHSVVVEEKYDERRGPNVGYIWTNTPLSRSFTEHLKKSTSALGLSHAVNRACTHGGICWS